MSLLDLAKATVEHLRKHGVSTLLIGGLAANVYRVEPRFTQDIDLVAALDAKSIGLILDLLCQFGYRPPPKKYEYKVGRFEWRRVVMPRPGEEPVILDVFFADADFLASVLARARRTAVEGVDLAYASPEDLLLFKFIAVQAQDRYARDEDDIRSILTNAREGRFGIEVEYLVSWAGRLGVLRIAQKFLRQHNLFGGDDYGQRAGRKTIT